MKIRRSLLILSLVLGIALSACAATQKIKSTELDSLTRIGVVVDGFNDGKFYSGNLDLPQSSTYIGVGVIHTTGVRQPLQAVPSPKNLLAQLDQRFADQFGLRGKSMKSALQIELTSLGTESKKKIIDALAPTEKDEVNPVDPKLLGALKRYDAIAVVTPNGACRHRGWPVPAGSVLMAEIPRSVGDALLMSSGRAGKLIWCSRTVLVSVNDGRILGYAADGFSREFSLEHELEKDPRFNEAERKIFRAAAEIMVDRAAEQAGRAIF